MLNTDDEVTSQNSDGDPMPDVIRARENSKCCTAPGHFYLKFSKNILVFTKNQSCTSSSLMIRQSD